MPKVTLYVKDADQEVWDRAKRLGDGSGESLSSFVSEALRAAVQRRDEALEVAASVAGRMEQVELQLHGPLNDHHTQTVRFTGVCVAMDDSRTIKIYMTRGGRFVLHFDHPKEGATHKVYRRLEDLRDEYKDVMDERLIADAFGAVGRPYVIDID
jgi:hypothetical protein